MQQSNILSIATVTGFKKLGLTFFIFPTAISCQQLDDPENGEVFFPALTFNSITTYVCNSGYVLNGGDTTRFCLATRLWSGTAPTCERK